MTRFLLSARRAAWALTLGGALTSLPGLLMAQPAYEPATPAVPAPVDRA